MKKIFGIFIINVLLLGVFLSFLEFYLYKNHKSNYPEVKYRIEKFPYKDILTIYTLRKPEGTNYKKRPLILAGCSYAYGQGLEENKTLGHKLSELTKRPVYNYSLPGKGLQNTLYMLQNKMFSPEIEDPEYVIYVFMQDQIRRMYSTVCLHDYNGYPEYKLTKDGTLKLTKDYYPIYKQFYTYYFFNNINYIYFYGKAMKHHSKMVTAYFRAINEEIKKQYPNTKFAILMYDDGSNNYGLDLSALENDGMQIIHTDELSDVILSKDEYHIAKNDFHPNEKAWDALLPKLIEKLSL